MILKVRMALRNDWLDILLDEMNDETIVVSKFEWEELQAIKERMIHLINNDLIKEENG